MEWHHRDCPCSECGYRRHRAPGIGDAVRYLRERSEYYGQVGGRGREPWATPPSHPGTFGDWLHDRGIGTVPPLSTVEPRAAHAEALPVFTERHDADPLPEPRLVRALRCRLKPEPRVLVSASGCVTFIYEPDDDHDAEQLSAALGRRR